MGGKSLVPAALPPAINRYPMHKRPVWTGAENSPVPESDPRTFQAVAGRYTVCAIPTHADVIYTVKYEMLFTRFLCSEGKARSDYMAGQESNDRKCTS